MDCVMKNMNASEIIDKYGNGCLRAAARELGISFSSLWRWKRDGRIPEQRLADVRERIANYDSWRSGDGKGK
jgi:hypothetical protein